MGKLKSKFVCIQCQYEFLKWSGQCSKCSSWNSLTEKQYLSKIKKSHITKLNSINVENRERQSTDIDELNGMLGGGLQRGGVYLFSGKPGTGKSTLFLEIIRCISEKTNILYTSGEETQKQIKLRCDRVGLKKESLYLSNTTDTEKIIKEMDESNCQVLIIDSVHTVNNGLEELVQKVKQQEIICLFAGQVNKEGEVLGALSLEHLVDVVLRIEFVANSNLRKLFATKNRFASTEGFVLFELIEPGIRIVGQTEINVRIESTEKMIGLTFSCDFSRNNFVLAEVQSLIVNTEQQQGSKLAVGLGQKKLLLLLAIIKLCFSKSLSSKNIYVKLSSVNNSDEHDLALVASILSSLFRKAYKENYIFIGCVDLCGRVYMNNKVTYSEKNCKIVTSTESPDENIVSISNIRELTNLLVS